MINTAQVDLREDENSDEPIYSDDENDDETLAAVYMEYDRLSGKSMRKWAETAKNTLSMNVALISVVNLGYEGREAEEYIDYFSRKEISYLHPA